MYTSRPEDIGPRLIQLEKTMADHGYDVKKSFRPGLVRAEIDRLTKGLPFRLPEELYRLYEWHDGSPDEGPLIFRDHRFTPLEEAVRNMDVLRRYKESPAFPFADFEGSYLLVPIAGYGVHRKLERPIIHLHESRDVYFYSVPLMLDTAIDWIREGVYKRGPEHFLDEKRELVIWRKHNPGVFDRSSGLTID